MFKKIGKYLLSAALVFTSVFAVAGCGKDDGDDERLKEYQVTEQQWKDGIDANCFETDYGEYVKQNLTNGAFNYILNYYGDDYRLRSTFASTQHEGSESVDLEYYKTNDTYQTAKYDYGTSGWGWYVNDITSEEYNSNVSKFIELINFVDNNYSKFQFGEYQFDGGYSLTGYKLNLAGSELETLITDILSQMKLSSYSVDNILVQYIDPSRGGVGVETGITISLMNGKEQIAAINKFKEAPIFYYLIETAISNVESYTIVNNSNDVNQITIEVDSTGFHVVAQSGEEYLKDNGDGTYTAYVKNGNTFTSYNYNDDYTYETEYKKYVTAHIHTLLEPRNNFEVVDGKYKIRNTTNTNSGTKYEYYFTNIEITLNSNNEIEKMTWDYKVHDKSINEDSPVYQITLTPGTTITYPTVG